MSKYFTIYICILIWLFCHCLHKRSSSNVCRKLDLCRAQPCWFAHSSKKQKKTALQHIGYFHHTFQPTAAVVVVFLWLKELLFLRKGDQKSSENCKRVKTAASRYIYISSFFLSFFFIQSGIRVSEYLFIVPVQVYKQICLVHSRKQSAQ